MVDRSLTKEDLRGFERLKTVQMALVGAIIILGELVLSLVFG